MIKMVDASPYDRARHPDNSNGIINASVRRCCLGVMYSIFQMECAVRSDICIPMNSDSYTAKCDSGTGSIGEVGICPN